MKDFNHTTELLMMIVMILYASVYTCVYLPIVLNTQQLPHVRTLVDASRPGELTQAVTIRFVA